MNILCWLLGHKFAREQWYSRDLLYTHYKCKRCGCFGSFREETE